MNLLCKGRDVPIFEGIKKTTTKKQKTKIETLKAVPKKQQQEQKQTTNKWNSLEPENGYLVSDIMSLY